MTTKSSLVLASAVALCLTGIGAHAQDLDKTKISYVGSWSSLSLYQNFEKPFWADHVPEASGGNISTQVTT
ncbi:MAG: C4-dicarboxylate ABC transporter substrate-binding protein, partial [Marinobacter sp.]|nr:C4-dicarboxylate ABC transporter substrate-binding protein [Marinobacter sp.]